LLGVSVMYPQFRYPQIPPKTRRQPWY